MHGRRLRPHKTGGLTPSLRNLGWDRAQTRQHRGTHPCRHSATTTKLSIPLPQGYADRPAASTKRQSRWTLPLRSIDVTGSSAVTMRHDQEPCCSFRRAQGVRNRHNAVAGLAFRRVASLCERASPLCFATGPHSSLAHTSPVSSAGQVGPGFHNNRWGRKDLRIGTWRSADGGWFGRALQAMRRLHRGRAAAAMAPSGPPFPTITPRAHGSIRQPHARRTHGQRKRQWSRNGRGLRNHLPNS